MVFNKKSIIKVSKNCENKFKNWLDKNKIFYWFIQQDQKTFSSALNQLSLKRPDFFLLIPNFGFIVVDVKNKSCALKHEKFFFSLVEVEKYLSFQRIFNIPCWFVVSNESLHYKTWFWIPVSKVMKSGFRFKVKNSDRITYSVPLTEFIQVSSDDSMDRVFSKFVKFI